MALLVLAHVDGHEEALAAEQQLGESPRRLRLADARGPGKQEHADGRVFLPHPGLGRAECVGDLLERLVLAADALCEAVFEFEEHLRLVLDHVADGDARPVRNDLGDDALADLGVNERPVGLLHLVQARVQIADVVGQVASGRRSGAAGGVEFPGEALLLAPACFQRLLVGGEGLALGLQLGHALVVTQPGGEVAAAGRQFRLHLVKAAAEVVERSGRRVLRHPHARRGGVDQVDRLVGQLAAGEVPVGEFDGGADGGVGDLDHVMVLVAVADAAHHHDGRLHVGLVHLDHLKAAGERGVLLDVLLVLAPRRRADGAQFAARERGLEQVGCVAGARRAPGADQRVRLVDEQDGRLGRVLDSVDDGLHARLELALDARARLEQAQVERRDLGPLEAVRHVARRDPQGQPFHDRRLADARLADQDRVVLAPPRQHVDHLADLAVAPENGVDGAVARLLRERLGVDVERRLALLAGGVCQGATAAGRGAALLGPLHEREEAVPQVVRLRLGHGLADGRGRERIRLQERLQERARADLGQPVVHRPGHERALDQVEQQRRERGPTGVAGPVRLDDAVERLADPARVHIEAGENERGVAGAVLQQLQQQVLDGHLVVAAPDGQTGGALQGPRHGVVELQKQALDVFGDHRGGESLAGKVEGACVTRSARGIRSACRVPLHRRSARHETRPGTRKASEREERWVQSASHWDVADAPTHQGRRRRAEVGVATEAGALGVSEDERRRLGRLEEQVDVVVERVGRVEADEGGHAAGPSAAGQQVAEGVQTQRADLQPELAGLVVDALAHDSVDAEAGGPEARAVAQAHQPRHVLDHAHRQPGRVLQHRPQALGVAGPRRQTRRQRQQLARRHRRLVGRPGAGQRRGTRRVRVLPVDRPATDFGTVPRPRPPQLGVRAVAEQVEEVAQRPRMRLARRDPLVEGRRERRVDAEQAAETDLDRHRLPRPLRRADVPHVGCREDARRVRADVDRLLPKLCPPHRVRATARRRQQADGLKELVPVPLAHERTERTLRPRRAVGIGAVRAGRGVSHTSGRWPRSGVHVIVRPEGTVSMVRWTKALIVA